LVRVLAIASIFIFNAVLAQERHLQRENVTPYRLLEQAQVPGVNENFLTPGVNYDLSLDSIDVVDGYYLAGDTVEPLFFISNLGSATSPQQVTVRFYLSTDTTIADNDLPLGAISIGSIAAGQSIGGIVPIPLPGPLDDGAYYLGAIISLEDKNTANNSNHDPLAINLDSSRTTGADLALLLADSPDGLLGPVMSWT